MRCGVLNGLTAAGFMVAVGPGFTGLAEAAATWTGPVRVTRATDACKAVKIAAGRIMLVSYSPRSTNGNSDISFAAKPMVYQVHAPEADFVAGGTYSNTFLVDANGTAVTMVGDSLAMKVLAFDQTPDEPLVGDQIISISGQFTAFMSRRGCTVKFRGKLVQQPD